MINETMLDSLRAEVSASMSPKRFRHTAAVEEMIARLCALYCPEQTNVMRVAALLHDITKELPAEEQVALCEAHGLAVTPLDRLSPKTFHARTAAAVIPTRYPDFAAREIVEAVRWHTTGHSGMTLCEVLLYLADYIDDTRTFDSCVLLRHAFWDADPATMTREERLKHLMEVTVMSFNLTLRDLIEEGNPIAADTADARNDLLLRLSAGELIS